MKRTGFTLVELLAVISVIIIIALLVTPKVTKTIEENRIKGYKEIENRLVDAAKKFTLENYIDPSLSSVTITKEQLINGNYIGEVKDIKDNSICDATVEILNLNIHPIFRVSLICNNYITENN